jgi:hypothetical protein
MFCFTQYGAQTLDLWLVQRDSLFEVAEDCKEVVAQSYLMIDDKNNYIKVIEDENGKLYRQIQTARTWTPILASGFVLTFSIMLIAIIIR